jgi:REP element-mobilizing transposase RayT
MARQLSLFPKRRKMGRPPTRKGDYVPHVSRPPLDKHHAAHITLKLLPHVGTLRTGKLHRVIRAAFVAGCDRFGFRLVHYSVQRDHIHLIAEADDGTALSRGIQGLAIRIAKGLNRVLGTAGRVFRERYHENVLTKGKKAFAALNYVLNNGFRHLRKLGLKVDALFIDPCSSGVYFDGWAPGVLRQRPPPGPRPVVKARSWVIKDGWRRYGPLVPGQIRVT